MDAQGDALEEPGKEVGHGDSVAYEAQEATALRLLNPARVLEELQRIQLDEESTAYIKQAASKLQVPGILTAISFFLSHIGFLVRLYRYHGGAERIAMCLRIRHLAMQAGDVPGASWHDRPGVGNVGFKEQAKLGALSPQQEEMLKKSVEEAAGLFLNTGVVSALILTVVSSMNFQILQPSQEALDSFSPETLASLQRAFTIFSGLTTCCSIIALYLAARQYNALTVWMPSLESKLWYLEVVGQLFMANVIIVMFWLLAVTLLVGFFLVQGPRIGGCIAGIGCGSFLLALGIETRNNVACGQHLWLLLDDVQKTSLNSPQWRGVVPTQRAGVPDVGAAPTPIAVQHGGTHVVTAM